MNFDHLLPLEKDIFQAIDSDNDELLDELRSPLRQDGGGGVVHVAVTDDFLELMLAQMVRDDAFNPRRCRLLCQAMSETLI
jgi:hypothetical protein